MAPKIFCIHQRLGFKGNGLPVNVYVLAGRDGLVFDSGLAWKKKRHYLVRKIRKISALMADRGMPCRINRGLASHGHWDHFAAFPFLKKDLGLEILATRDQAAKITSKKKYLQSFESPKPDYSRPELSGAAGAAQNAKDRLLHEVQIRLLNISFVSKPLIIGPKERLRVDDEIWRVIQLPGHCDDDIALFNEARGILLAGDILFRTVNSWIGPPQSDLEQYINSLEAMLEIPGLKLILPAHGSPITAPRKRILKAIAHRKKRIREIFDLLSKSGPRGMSFEAVLQTFYPGLRFYRRATLGGWIALTLYFLVDKGAAVAVQNGRHTNFKPGALSPEEIL